MAKTQKTNSGQKEGNRYTRAARVLAKNDKIDVKTLADRAFMSESTAARCLEAWQACVAALIEVGRLPGTVAATQTKKAAPKPKPAPAKPVDRGRAGGELDAVITDSIDTEEGPPASAGAIFL